MKQKQRLWSYVELASDGGTPAHRSVSDDQIIEQYYPYWSASMIKAGKADLINRERCIQDFVTVHWCWEMIQMEAE